MLRIADDFSGTAATLLESHAVSGPNAVGGSWHQVTGNSGEFAIASGGSLINSPSGSSGCYYNDNAEIASASRQTVIVGWTPSGGGSVYLLGMGSASAFNGYLAGYEMSNNRYAIYKANAGTLTLLHAMSVAASEQLAFEAQFDASSGTSCTITMISGDVIIGSYTDSSSPWLTGPVGILAYSAANMGPFAAYDNLAPCYLETGNVTVPDILIAQMGDSITDGVCNSVPGSGRYSTPSAQIVDALTARYTALGTPKRLTCYNCGVSGAAANSGPINYLSSFYPAYKSQLQGIGVALSCVNLNFGTNESSDEGGSSGTPARSQAQFQADLQALIAQILADFSTAKIVVNAPIWFSQPITTSFHYDAGSQAAVVVGGSYQLAITAAVASFAVSHPGRVFGGDMAGPYNEFQANATALLALQTVSSTTFRLHPNDVGAVALGTFKALDIEMALGIAPLSVSAPGFLWYVLETAGGTIDSSGNYTAPEAAGTYHIVAVSNADPTQVGVSTVVVS